MTLLDRHIFKSVLGTCAAAIGLFAFVLITGNVVRDLVGPLLSGQIDYPTFVRLVLLTSPVVLSYALPLGTLSGVLLTLGRLSADSEITAMRAAGIGVPRIAFPIFLLGFLGMLLGLKVNFESMPWAKVKYEQEFAAAVRANPLSFLVPKTFIRDFPGYVVHVGDRHGSLLTDFWLWQLDSQHRAIRMIQAESGRVDYDEPANELVLTLLHARVENRDPNKPEDFSVPPYEGSFEQSDPIHLSLARFFGHRDVHSKLAWMTYPQLRAQEARISAEPATTRAQIRDRAATRMEVELAIQNKFTSAVAIFSFALIAVPLGIKVSRRETSANLGVAVALFLGYYFLTVAIGWLDRHPEYRPDLLLWVPDLLCLGLGAWFVSRIDRR